MEKPTAKNKQDFLNKLQDNSSTDNAPFWFVTAGGHPFKKTFTENLLHAGQY